MMAYAFSSGEIEIYCGVEHLEINILDFNNEKKEVVYEVKNVPICEFDQHSRARIGVEFYDFEISKEPKYTFYTSLCEVMQRDSAFTYKVLGILYQLEEIIRKKDNFLSMSYFLMSRNCSYKVRQSFESLRGQMSRRLKFCEESSIVGVHWLLRDKLIKLGLKEARDFLPHCDISQECEYSKDDYLSNLFGCLFSGCNRWLAKTQYATFNRSCSDMKTIEKQLNISISSPSKN